MIHIKGFKVGYGYCGIVLKHTKPRNGSSPSVRVENFFDWHISRRCPLCQIFAEAVFDVPTACKRLTILQVQAFGRGGGKVGPNWRELAGVKDARISYNQDDEDEYSFYREPWAAQIERIITSQTVLLKNGKHMRRKDGIWKEINL